MKIATYNGGAFDSGSKLSCDLCGEKDFDKLHIHNLGISVGMGGNDYSFCAKCWNGENLGRRLLQLLGYESGIFYNDELLTFTEVDTEK